MKKVTNIFQLLTALFFGVGLVYFLTYDRMWGGSPEAGEMVSWFLAGLVLYLITWGAGWALSSSLENKIKKTDQEKKELKAMVFDLERGVKMGQMDKKIEDQPDDKDSSSIKPRENFK